MKLPPKISTSGWAFEIFRDNRARTQAIMQAMKFIKTPEDRRAVRHLARAWAEFARKYRKECEMSKDIWMQAVEEIGERLSDGEIDRDEAISGWRALGFDRDEAEAEADAATE